MAINRSHIGRNVKLNELPDGYMSKDYDLTLNRRYKLVDFFGSCAVVLDNAGARAYVYAGRFQL